MPSAAPGGPAATAGLNTVQFAEITLTRLPTRRPNGTFDLCRCGAGERRCIMVAEDRGDFCPSCNAWRCRDGIGHAGMVRHT